MGADRPFRRLPLLAILAMAWLALYPLKSADVYYHLAVGRTILETRAIPERGVGSATHGQAPWHDNEWGFQALAAAIGRGERDPSGVLVLTPGGAAALVIWRALTLAVTLGLLSATMARRGVDPLTRACAVVLAAFLTFGNLFWEVRPQMLSYLGLAATAWLLERDRGGSRWALPALLALMPAWASVHGAFVVGIALWGAEAAGAMAEDRRRGARLLAGAAAAPLAACLNPLGWRQVAHPFLYVLRPEIVEGNAEWARPDLLHLPLHLLTLALAGAAIAVGRPRGWVGDALKLLLFGGLSLTALRHLPLAALVLVPVAAAGLAAAGGRRLPTAAGPPGRRAAWAAAVVAVVVALSGAKFIGPVPRPVEEPVRPMPERAARLLAGGAVEGNGFNAYRFGAFLMYRLHPREVVFMDGRNDLYGTFRQQVYNRILATGPGWSEAWEEAVERYRIGWVLLDEGEPLLEALRGRPGWLDRGVVDGRPGEPGIVLVLRDTPAHRELLARGPG